MAVFIFLTIYYSCNNKNKVLPTQKSGISLIAVVGEKGIRYDEIDSLGRIEIYNMRKQKLEQVIIEELLTIEAKKYELTKEAYLEQFSYDKTGRITDDDILQFMRLNPGFSNKEEVNRILLNITKKEKLKKHIDSLSIIYKVESFLLPEYHKVIDTSNIKGISLNNCGNDKDKVFLIVNFDCQSCIEFLLKMREIIYKYNNSIIFELIYLDSSFELPAKAIAYADHKNIGGKLIEQLINNPDSIHSSKFYSKFFSIDTSDGESFDKIVMNGNYLINMLKVRDDLFRQEIYSTPSLVINGKLYEGSFTQNELEFLMSSIINSKN